MVTMKQGYYTFDQKVSTDAVTRNETFMGRDYLVVPVIALVQGVIQASNAPEPELALASEFARVPDSWNARPLMMGHPKDSEGNPISANSPNTLTSHQIGFMFNTQRKDNAAGKPSLYTEAWIDIQRCKDLGGSPAKVLAHCEKGEMVEVSTGLYSAAMPEMGTFDGKKYANVWREVVPDHLAFLEDGTLGACSIEDGCGSMRTNTVKKDGTNTEDTTVKTKQKVPKSKKSMRYNTQGLIVAEDCGCTDHNDCKCPKDNEVKPTVNEADRLNRLLANSYPDQMVDRDVRTLLDLAVCETFEGYCSLLMFSRNILVFVWYDMESWASATYQVPFNLDDSGKVTFTGPAEEVALLTKIVPVQDAEVAPAITTNEGNPPMTVKDTTVTEPPIQAVAITNLAQATPEQLETAAQLIAAAQKKSTPQVADSTAPISTVLSVAEAPKVLSTAEYIAQAPEGVRDVLNEGMRMQTARKNTLITELKASGRCEFGDDELNKMSLQMLERLGKLSLIPTFNGMSTPRSLDGSGTGDLRDNEGPVPAPLKIFETSKPN